MFGNSAASAQGGGGGSMGGGGGGGQAAVQQQGGGRLAGYLGKSSAAKGKGWQTRWFVLDAAARTLTYYKDKDAQTLFTELDADRCVAAYYNMDYPQHQWPQSPRIASRPNSFNSNMDYPLH